MYSFEWTCCSGTGVENHVKYQENVYFTTDNTLYIGLYLPSTAAWAEKNVTIKQECEYPAEYSKITLTGGGNFDVKLRVPFWATAGYTLKVNGKVIVENPEVSTYVSAGSVWSSGDVIEVFMPFEKRLDITPDQRSGRFVGAVMYGPIVMALPTSSTSTSTWPSITVDACLVDDTLFAANGADASNLYTVTVNGNAFKPINSIWTITGTRNMQRYYTYFELDIRGEINSVLKTQLFNKLQQAHAYPLGTLPNPADKVEGFQAAIKAATPVYRNGLATAAQIGAQIAALDAALSELFVPGKVGAYVNAMTSFGGKVEYVFGVKDMIDINLVDVTFTANGVMVYKDSAVVQGLEGFQVFNSTGQDIDWTYIGDGQWRGHVILLAYSGVTKSGSLDVGKLLFDTAKLGDATLTITGIEVYGIDTSETGASSVKRIAEIDPASATTKIFSIYDIEKGNGSENKVDWADLSLAAFYYQSKLGDANWEFAKVADVNGDGIVNMADLILIYANFID